MLGLSLGDSGGHDPHPDLGHELDADPGRGVGALQVVDQLREILDAVDVVVGRRRDEPHPGHRVARGRDLLGHLVPGQLAALPGLGSLRHLDLQLVRVREVGRGDPEPSARHLLDRRPLVEIWILV